MGMEISVTDFKAKCLELIDKLSRHEIEEIELTKHGKPIAVIRPLATAIAQAEAIHGSMRGSTRIPVDLDLTAPIFDGVIDAEAGVLHR